MNYLGITAKTIEWLLANNNLLTSFKRDIRRIYQDRALSEGVMVADAMRVTSINNNLVCVWNNDYLSGTDAEDWGFIKLINDFGIMTVPQIYEEVLERCLNVISLRMQGLNLPDDRYIHRAIGENNHTCLAGRGEAARKYSIGWYEDKVTTNKGSYHSIVIVGPSNIEGFDVINNALNNVKPALPRLLEMANDLLVKSIQRPTLANKYFVEFRNSALDRIISYDLPEGDKQLEKTNISDDVRYTTLDWTYEDWVNPESPLTALQREIIKSDIILRQPLRIIGAAGTGKSLLMQLLAMKRLEDAKKEERAISIFYVVHNNEMAVTVRERFITLGACDFLNGRRHQHLVIKTLFEYACEELNLDNTMLLDKDASQTKMFQRFLVIEYIEEIIRGDHTILRKSDLINKISEDFELRDVFADFVVSEIGIGIKGRDLSSDQMKYVESEKPLTRFHGILNREERTFVYSIFRKYYERVTLNSNLLDSDDVAITFLGTLKTPLWLIKRKKKAFDFVFIDETQLFNQNERQIFKFLTKNSDSNLPIVIALDEAQEVRGSSNSGFGALGIEHLANETLPNVHRSTKEILQLAFFVIQRTTDLFGTDFPDFTRTTTAFDKNESSEMPKLKAKGDLTTQLKREISNLRRNGVRQIAIIVHAERYFKEIADSVKTTKENVVVAEKRGELIDPQRPIIYIARPDLIGGQEFDAVIAVGLEHGVTPPLVNAHAGLTETLEQQNLREIYLSFTRAKRHLVIINKKNSSPTNIIQQAIDKRIIEVVV